MHVLHVISSIDSRAGGPSNALLTLAGAQARAGLEVSVLATYSGPAAPEDARKLGAAGVKVEMLGPTQGRLMRHPRLPDALAEAIGRADIVHVHGVWEEVQYQAARIARGRRIPYVITPHGMLTHWSLGQRRWKKMAYVWLRLRGMLKGAAAIHYTTPVERDALGLGGVRAPALVEPLGVDLGEFEMLPPKGSFNARYPQLEGKRIVMFLGRIHKGKGLEYLVPAFAKAKLGETMLVAVGPDSRGFLATIQALVEEHKVRDRVLFTGMLQGAERVEALRDADLFALPSEHENFGVSVVEALACGVPVLISEGVGIAGQIERASVGEVLPLEIDRLTEALRRWMGDEKLRAEAAGRARSFVREQFDWREVAQRWRGHYDDLVHGRALAGWQAGSESSASHSSASSNSSASTSQGGLG